jgi:hypothetical protein
MPIQKNKNTQENREFWSHVETTSDDVNRWLSRESTPSPPASKRVECASSTDKKKAE